ncbi:hypothetical protein RBB50_005209 [Rhinocladiella similis]
MPDDRVTIDLNSESIRSSLLDAFWTFNDVWTLVVDRAIFTPHKAHGVASQYDNAVLEDATRGGASPGNEKHTSPETIWRAYCLVAWSELCVLIARIQDILNGGESWGTHSMKQLSTMLKNVQKWYDALPLELSWNEEDEPTLTPSGYGQLEVQIEYILKFVRRMQEEGIKSVVIGEKAGKDLNDHMDTWHKVGIRNNLVDGKPWIWSGSGLHYMRSTKEPKYEHYSFEYQHKNIFAYLGNGLTEPEVKKQRDRLAPYIRNSDTPWEL